MFKYFYDHTHFLFYFTDSVGGKIPCSNWDSLQSTYLSQLAILNELIDNGSATQEDACCRVDNITVLMLSDDVDKKILGLPSSYPYELLIDDEGTPLQDTSFKFKYRFYDFYPNGAILPVKRVGAIIEMHQNSYLLSKNQYTVCQLIDEFNSLQNTERGGVNNLQQLAELKKLSTEKGITLNYFLSGQELLVPEKIKLGVNFNNGELEIFPDVVIDNGGNFVRLFDKFPKVLDIYPVSNNGNTTRVVISKNQNTELQKVKQKRRVSTTADIQKIVEHPELLFDEETTDFSIFYSERVKEIGLYKPKFYPFISPYRSLWIPGILIKDKIDGEKRIYFKSKQELNEFIKAVENAIAANQQSVRWGNVEINIQDALEFIRLARLQFKNPEHPITKLRGPGIIVPEVLIIKDNAECIDFIPSGTGGTDGKHIFYGIDNLQQTISLKEHQKEGVAWLQLLFKNNFSGGLLADDMGLGKTLQLLYFIEWHHSQYPLENKPYLIIAPVGLLENWENEYRKFFSPTNLKLYKLYGRNNKLTRELAPQQNLTDAQSLQTKKIILTNYETVTNYQISLGLVDFAIVALDEAQKIKTPGTMTANATKALKTDFRIAITGTPVENTLVDIWSIMDFVAPSLLGSAREFVKKYQTPLCDPNTDIPMLTGQLRNSIGIFIKRRLITDIALDLPQKHDDDNSRIKKIMPPAQLERYMREIASSIKDTEQLEGVARGNRMLQSIWAIRNISDHPFLLDDNNILDFTTQELVSSSSKLKTTIEILMSIKEQREKVIVFTDRKGTQRMLAKVIYETFTIVASIINGETPTTEQLQKNARLSRQQCIDQFEEKTGFNIIIMSPLAAGVGLNITAANHVVHYTRHWNPAKEDQATARAYRIGQQRPVHVYYPMAIFSDAYSDAAGQKIRSFDEVLDDLLMRKRILASNALFPTEQAEIVPEELFSQVFNNTIMPNI
ncbi:MAG: SNF2-related protein [Phycisphaerales bacterium]|nr:SNF2-related protein [Phycisphaerales bacterium]